MGELTTIVIKNVFDAVIMSASYEIVSNEFFRDIDGEMAMRVQYMANRE